MGPRYLRKESFPMEWKLVLTRVLYALMALTALAVAAGADTCW